MDFKRALFCTGLLFFLCGFFLQGSTTNNAAWENEVFQEASKEFFNSHKGVTEHKIFRKEINEHRRVFAGFAAFFAVILGAPVFGSQVSNKERLGGVCLASVLALLSKKLWDSAESTDDMIICTPAGIVFSGLFSRWDLVQGICLIKSGALVKGLGLHMKDGLSTDLLDLSGQEAALIHRFVSFMIEKYKNRPVKKIAQQ